MKFKSTGLTRALSHPDYLHFFLGQIIVTFGFWMQNIASSWLVYRLTGSSLLLGTVSLCATLPSLIASPLAGIIADKYPKKYILYCTMTCFMLASFVQGILILTETVQVWNILVNALIIGTVMAVESPARSAFLFEIVGREDLQNSIALNSSVFNLGRLAGPAIGGALVPIIGEGWLYISNAFAILWMIYSVTKISVIGYPVPKVEGEKNSIKDGFTFSFKQKEIRYSLCYLAFGTMCMFPVSVLLPVVSVEILQGDSRLLGLLMGSMGVGSFISALVYASRSSTKTLLKWLVYACFAFAVGITGFAFSTSVPLTMLFLAILGSGSSISMSSINTLIQLVTPDKYRGKVSSIYSMTFMGLGVVGATFAGTSGEYFGVKETILISSVVMIFSAIIFLPLIIKYAKEKLNNI